MLHKYLDCDFYWVEIDKDGNKVVHPYGFVYDAEESVDDDEPDLTFRFQTFCYDTRFRLEKVIDSSSHYYDLLCDYIDFDDTEDKSEEEANRLLCNSLDVEEMQPIELPIADITKDTPCGWYVDYYDSSDN